MRNLLGGKGANLAEMTNIGYLYQKVLPLQPKHVQDTMMMVRPSCQRSNSRSMINSLNSNH